MVSENRPFHHILATVAVLLALTVQVSGAEGNVALESELGRAQFKLVSGDVVVFLGGTNTVRAAKAGCLEALLTHGFAAAKPRFRDFSWEGDTVYEQGTVGDRWREPALGGWKKQLERVGATVILAQYGQIEVLQGRDGLEEFSASYEKLLTTLAEQTQRIILISPTPFEKSAPLFPDLSSRNADLRLYVDAIRGIARQRGFAFVDVFTPFVDSTTRPAWTENGVHLAPSALPAVATAIARRLGGRDLADPIPANGAALGPTLEPLRTAIVWKNGLWLDYWRPANWKCLFGDDSGRVFGQAAGNHPPFLVEWAQFPSLIEQAEEQIWEAANLPKKTGKKTG